MGSNQYGPMKQGRGVFATKNLKKGELIIVEKSLATSFEDKN